MKGESWLLIVNPVAGGGRAGDGLQKVLAAMADVSPGDFEHVLTRAPGHASELARAAVEAGHSVVLSLGGDGTHNEVLNGLLDDEGRTLNRDLAFAPLPSGTGGDFARLLYNTRDPAVAVRTLATARPQWIDLGSCTYTANDADGVGAPSLRRIFLNIASFGLSGEVDRWVHRTPTMLGARGSYLLATLCAVMHYSNQPIRLCIDGEEHPVGPVQNVAIANGQYFGGGMRVAPEARLSDGRFDVVVLGDLHLTDMLMLSNSIYAGTHGSHSKVTTTSATRVEAWPAQADGPPILVDIDGEQLGRLPLAVEMVADAIQLLVPEET